ncbi:MAG: hypothetical protein WC492_04225 [Candidatus Micrarchaeia archaeon]
MKYVHSKEFFSKQERAAQKNNCKFTNGDDKSAITNRPLFKFESNALQFFKDGLNRLPLRIEDPTLLINYLSDFRNDSFSNHVALSKARRLLQSLENFCNSTLKYADEPKPTSIKLGDTASLLIRKAECLVNTDDYLENNDTFNRSKSLSEKNATKYPFPYALGDQAGDNLFRYDTLPSLARKKKPKTTNNANSE